jgi:anti-sigma factor RsiW
MTTEALSCQELVELVTEYLEEAMAADERRRFEEHLDQCGGCKRYVEQMRETIRLVGRLTPEAIGPEAEAALLTAFRGWNSR